MTLPGPEDIPYTALSRRADLLSLQHNTEHDETLFFLIDSLPEDKLATLKNSTYSRIAETPNAGLRVSDLEDLSWADSVDKQRMYHRQTLGVYGAVAGAGTVIMAAVGYDQLTAQQSSSAEPPQNIAEYITDAGFILAPILAGGVIGAAFAKKFTDRRLKWSSRKFVEDKQSSSAGDSIEPRGNIIAISHPFKKVKEFSAPRAGKFHPDRVEEIRPFKTAQRWAHSRKCDDESRYPDFLAAEMGPSELSALLKLTRQRFEGLTDGSGEITLTHDQQVELLRDMQIVHAIEVRRSKIQKFLGAVLRTGGYAVGTIYCGFALQAASERGHDAAPQNPATTTILLAAMAAVTAVCGWEAQQFFAGRTGLIGRQYAKWKTKSHDA